MQLLRQLRGTGEAARVAQTFEKIDSQRLTIQVGAGVADEVDFDFAALFAESWIGTDIGGAGIARAGVMRVHGVDAIRRDKRGELIEVGGGEAERLTTALAGDDSTGELIG